MSYKTDADHKPVDLNYPSFDHWERGLDPWHREAAPSGFEDSFPNQDEERKEGWFACDWVGNPIAFVPDGTPQIE